MRLTCNSRPKEVWLTAPWMPISLLRLLVSDMKSKISEVDSGVMIPMPTPNKTRMASNSLYTPNVDCGDNVIIVNADKVQLTGNKWNDRVYVRYTGFPGGQREFTPADLMAKGADKLVRKVVKGMLPKNRLGARQITNLYIFAGAEHNMQAQQPKVIDINTLK